MSSGNIKDIREILEIEPSEQDEKILRFIKLSNIWLNTFAPSNIIKNLDAQTKNTAVNLHVVYLFTLSASRFSAELPPVATQFKDEGSKILERAINNKANTFKLLKENDEFNY